MAQVLRKQDVMTSFAYRFTSGSSSRAALASLPLVLFACGGRTPLGDDSTINGPDSGGSETSTDSSSDQSSPKDSSTPDSSPGCSTNADCLETQYCHKGVGNCSGKGTCLVTPGICPSDYAPVCGCDKKTYGNSCEASGAGVNEDYEGVCEGPR